MPIMATQATRVPIGSPDPGRIAAVQRTWRMHGAMSRFADGTERFLAGSGFDRGPWLTVGFAAGIGLWFALPLRLYWIAAVIGLIGMAAVGHLGWRHRPGRTMLRLAVVSLTLTIAAGTLVISIRSQLVGAVPIERPASIRMEATVLEFIEEPAKDRVRLVIATRDPETGAARKVRINVPRDKAIDGLTEGARIRLSARLMPPAPPLLPGAYDFARAAWFKGYAATGSLVGDITLVSEASETNGRISRYQRQIAAHIRSQLGGSAGTIAAAFASGDRGAIAVEDEIAMRDSGLTHLLSISGLHVSAVIAAGYVLALRLLALWPGLALRVRLPLMAAGFGALVGVSYTLLTGAEVPTVRSCVGAMLILIALALGREPLSLRMIAIAAGLVLALWPEAVIGPSFQMSFSAVIAIVALHSSEPVRSFLAPRDSTMTDRFARQMAMLFVTGLVIELALMPIVLFHFHRGGFYGAFANVVAIPLTTFICMPLIAVALLLDLAGLGAPVWWLTGKALDLLLAIAHFTAGQPGAVKLIPQIGMTTVLAFVAGGLWLALWSGRARLFGFIPMIGGALAVWATPVPDLLITGDGKNVGLTSDDGRFFVLRGTKGGYTHDNLVELAGIDIVPQPLARLPGARCSPEFCSVTITRAGLNWHVLVARNRQRIDERQLAAACERAHLVVADRWLPRSCRPLWLKADRRFLEQYGGTAIYFAQEKVVHVRPASSDHGWAKASTRTY